MSSTSPLSAWPAARLVARGLVPALLLACGSRPSPPPAVSQPPASAEAALGSARALPGASAVRFVWADASGEGRLQVVWFRRELTLAAPPDEATLQLFASSRYLLFVNGNVVASGPARSYPEHPEFDSIDLRPHLVAGRNTLAVQVASFGTSSFQLRRQPGSFAAWGTLRAGSHGEDLSTPGAWLARRDAGYDATAPRLSFAEPPIELYDARQDGPRFPEANTGSLTGWSAPVLLSDQSAWGPLRPRSIPALERRWLAPKALSAAFALDDSEALLSFRVPVPDVSHADYQRPHLLLARTRIWSPRAQRVPFGLWWGSYYINGQGPLVSAGLSPGQRNRNLVMVPLRAGYNDFFVRYTSVFGSWDFYLSAPRVSGLEFSARGQHDDAVVFETAGPFSAELEQELMQSSMPLSRGSTPALDWQPIARGERSVNPALEVSWRKTAAALPLDPSRTHDIPIAAGRDSALVFDLGGTQLGRLLVDYDAPAGTAIDLAWAEELAGGRPDVLQQNGLFTAARHVSAGGNARFQTIQPYGMRYLQLNVSGHSAPVTLRRVGLVSERYPFEQHGRFESSDPALNALWEMGWRTLRVCAEDSYVDTPFRERALYAGDLLVELAVTLATSGDLRLAQRSLRLLHDMYRDLFVSNAPRHPDELGLLEDFPLLSLEAYRWLIEATGDLAFARELFPGYQHLLEGLLARRGPDGAITSERVFIEWTLPESEQVHVENTAYHALFARALASFAQVAGRLGENDLAARYAAASDQLGQLLERRFWDASAGAFVDGTRGGIRSRSHLPISSAWPSFWGLTSAAQEQRLQAFWRARFGADAPLSSQTSPYGAFFLLGAFYRHDQAALAEDYMRRYWAPMLADPEGTLWEHFDRHAGTSSHAWSAAPTYYLSTQVLGVNLGYPEPSPDRELVIAPRAESIDWARGAVPHPRGLVEVDWRVAGDLLRMNVRVPPGVHYRVAPRGRLARLRLELNGALQAATRLDAAAPGSEATPSPSTPAREVAPSPAAPAAAALSATPPRAAPPSR